MGGRTEVQVWGLVEAVQRLSLARTSEDVQEVVGSAARNLCGADGATLVLRDGPFCRYVDEDAIAPLWKGQRFPLESCISGWAMLQREAVAIEDIYADDRIPHDAYRATFVKSLAMVPIRHDDPLGAIGAYWAQRHAPTAGEMALLQALADSAAVAMENVRVWCELEHRVADRTAKLEHALHVNERILGTLAHEIRNSLAASGGLLELVLRAPEDQLGRAPRDLVEHAHRAAVEGSRIVEDQLVAAKDRAGELRPQYAQLDVAAFLEDLRAVHAALKRNPDVEVVVAPGACPAVVRTDGQLLLQALRNLVSNALKFTPAGEVRLGATPAGPGWVSFWVSDTGAGIPAADHDRVFDEWSQGHEDPLRRGSGLGLPFVRRIAALLGGRVAVTSVVGRGSTFTITIPDQPAPPPTRPPRRLRAGQGRTARPAPGAGARQL